MADKYSNLTPEQRKFYSQRKAELLKKKKRQKKIKKVKRVCKIISIVIVVFILSLQIPKCYRFIKFQLTKGKPIEEEIDKGSTEYLHEQYRVWVEENH